MKRMILAFACFGAGTALLAITNGSWTGAIPGVPLLLISCVLAASSLWDDIPNW